jgi:hypothetical protein
MGEFIKRFIFSIRNNNFVYKNIINRKRVALHKDLSKGSNLNDLQSRIVLELRNSGIAITTFSELFPEENFEDCLSWIEQNETNLKLKEKKKFLMSYYGTDDNNKIIDLKNPFVKLYLTENLLRIVCSYLGYVPQLFEVYIEKTIPVGQNEPVFSQNWHRDPEEKRTMKVFMYLNDVDDFCGPFTYLKKSQPTSKSSYASLFKQKLPWGSYPSESQIISTTSPVDHFIATGKKGTIIFCDTAGLHKGGHAKSGYRVMSTGYFPSKHLTELRKFKQPNSKDLQSLGGYAQAVLL